MANKAFKYRIYPNEQQEEMLWKTFGCVRFVYNQILAKQEDNYKNGIRHMSKLDANTYCNHELKREYPWLREVDKFALTNSIYHLEDGFQRFFHKLGGYPKFKSRHNSRQSYTTNYTNGNIKVLDEYGKVQLPKLGKIRAKIHRPIPENYKIKSATVSVTPDGCFYVSVLLEYNEEPSTVRESVQEKNLRVLGLDYKSDGLYTDSNGNTKGSPKYYRKTQKKLNKAQRRLSRKCGGKRGEAPSHNYQKQKQKVARIHAHVANQRKDFLHKASTEIANQYDVVCVEDLNMKAIANKKFGNGKATMDNGYGMFLDYLEYKLKDRDKRLVKVDKWYPSSQICSCCGRQKKIQLSERTYRCACGNQMDRDYNAAVNIRNEGLRLLAS